MKKLHLYILVVAISILPFVSLFTTPDMPHTHDGPVQLPRIAAYYKALTQGQIPPRWASDLNYGYGMPLFNFYYHTPYLIASLFVSLGTTLVTSFKLTLLTSFILSGVFMLMFGRAWLGDDKKALLLTIFYQFIPYRLVEYIIRGSFGELYVFTFLPLILYGIVSSYKEKASMLNLATIIGTAFLILSHNSISFMAFLFAFLFALVTAPNRNALAKTILSLFIGVLLVSFYWIPVLLERKYTYGDLFIRTMYQSHFPPLSSFFLPNFTENKSLQTGGVSTQIGLLHSLALIMGFLLLIRPISTKKYSKHTRPLLLFLITTVAGSIFMMQKVSQPIWEHIALLRLFQFPWRFLSVTGIATSFLSISFFFYPFFRRNVIYITILLLTIFSTIVYWVPPLGFDKIDSEEVIWNYPLNTTYFGETDVIWSAGQANEYPKNRVEVIEGTAQVIKYKKQDIRQTFEVNAETPAKIASLTQYFPGWRVYVDGKITPVQFQDVNWRGLITFPVSQGQHSVVILFERTIVRLVSEFISLGIFVGLIIFVFLHKKRII